jgi:hypothetical protein
VQELQATTLLNCVENVHPATLVLVHLYKADIESCVRFNSTLDNISTQFTLVRFCRLVVTEALPNYDDIGLPALTVFRGGEQIKSFVPLTHFIGHRFSDQDVVRFLFR